MSREGADRMAAWATGVGIGFAALMVTWLIGNRLAGLIWDPPLGPSVALGAAILTGLSVGFFSGRRLAAAPEGRSIRRSLRREAPVPSTSGPGRRSTASIR